MEGKSSNNTQLSFWWKAKSSSYEICLRGLRTRSAPNIAEVVPSGFICPQPWFLWRSEHIFLGKTPACSCRSASCHGKRNSLNLTIPCSVSVLSVVVFVPARDPGSILIGDMNYFFFSFFFLLNDLNESIFTNY